MWLTLYLAQLIMKLYLSTLQNILHDKMENFETLLP